MKTGKDDFAVRDWLAADGDGRAPRDTRSPEGSVAMRRDAPDA